MKKLPVLAVAGLLSASANATNWVLVQSYSSGEVYVDTNSITNTYPNSSKHARGYNHDSYKQAFVRADFREMQELSSNKTYNQMIGLDQFDCKSNPKKIRTIAIKVSNDFNAVGAYVYPNADWRLIYPDTLDDITSNFICSY